MSEPRRDDRLALSIALLVLALGCGAPERPAAVVLMIGDGLGVSQISFARRMALEPGARFRFESLPETALVRTFSTSNPTTDSAAAATALATGVKTHNRFVGVDPAGRPLRTLAELARERGWGIGYVTSTSITHATPAGFYAHVYDRYDDEARIADQLLEHRPDVALGGGRFWFLPESEGGWRRDGRNLLEEARAAGFAVWGQEDLQLDPPPGPLLGLFAGEHLALRLDEERRPEAERQPSLETLTRLAVAALERRGRPFFLLVEGGRIDHGSHSFDPMATAREVAGFDGAVAAVLELRGRQPGTLVLVTADHATGGLAINDYVDWQGLARQRASIEWMAERIRRDGAGPELLAEMTGYGDFQDGELEPVRREPNLHQASRLLGTRLSRRHGLTWMPPEVSQDTKGHTGEDVPLYAAGPGAERFQGVLENADVPRILSELLGWEPLN